MIDPLFASLEAALAAREALTDEWAAQRLFNGFYEGCPELVVDRYAHTLLIFNYANPPEPARSLVTAAQNWLLPRCLWARAVVVKERFSPDPAMRSGTLTWGASPDRKIRENGVWYALDLFLNQDASFYLDTRGLRAWLKHQAAGKTVLNAFAYTGSLGVAALAGGAQRVLQLDLNRKFLNLAKDSCTLNGLPVVKANYLTGDFYPLTARLRREARLFDIVILDPPFFSATSAGRVDQAAESARLINKVRPLIADGGCLVAINNALFLSGADYLSGLQALCADGYMQVETFVDVPLDCAGYPPTRLTPPPTDPAPFNHPTKIAILRIRRKPAPSA